MTRQTVRDAYSDIHPTQEQKDRMWNAILEEREKRPLTVRKEKPRGGFRPSAVAAVLSFAAVLAVVIWFGGEKLLNGKESPAEMSAVAADSDSAAMEQGQWLSETSAANTFEEERAVSGYGSAEETLYRPLLEKYVAAIRENKDSGQCSNEDISYMVGFLTDLNQLGWCLQDLDGNGTQELIVSDGNVIYDLYTLENGEAVHILSGGERNAYRLCGNGIIKNFGSNSAAESSYNMYRLVGSSLVQEQLVTFDAARDSVNPWFVGFEQTPASESEAQSVIDSYQEMEIAVTPFSQGQW